jgi:hypothetical protein
MTRLNRYLVPLFLATGALQAQESADIIIYGGTSASIAAAVQAKKMGVSVIVVSPDKHLGGLSSGGLGFTDSGRKETIGGVSREFYQKIYQHYEKEESWKWQKREEYGNKGQGHAAIDGANRTAWIFEPHAAEGVFEGWVKEHDLKVVRDAWLDRENGVTIEDGKITSIKTLDGKTYSGKTFIDTTYEGDLMAAAKVPYIVGRESSAQYNETLNGNQPVKTVKHQFDFPVDPYIKPGDKSSGLVPRIEDAGAGVEGAADKGVQAYCFRMCMTNHAPNRVPFPKPEKYDPMQYELLARYLQAGWNEVFRKFDGIQNHKTDTNNHGAFSSDNIGYNHDYPEASYERRREIIKEHEEYQKGFYWFLCHDPRVPKVIQDKMNTWGLAKDEFKDNNNWPHQLYIRVARRMVSDFVITENHLTGKLPTPKSIGMGSYQMDSHNIRRFVDENGHARNEGDIQVSPGRAYEIDYGSIVPPEKSVQNLLVPVCVSSSHISYGSIRMEPVFMILGQSAATAAVHSQKEGVSVQKISYEKLKERLEADGQVLHWTPPAKK